MHFLKEACTRKPLESKELAYSRAATAICMCCLFLAYVGYLISQLYYDTPLIVLSSEQMPDNYHAVDAEFCVEKSTMSFSYCSYANRNWDPQEIPGCTEYIKPENLKLSEKCYMFMANDSYKMVTSDNSDMHSARRFDFYWSIDNLTNVTKIALSIPAISIQLYDPLFNPKRKGTIGNSPKQQQVKTYLAELSQRATNTINQTSIIYYVPQRYYEIKPRNFRAFLGFTPDYNEINTLKLDQGSWPISDSPPKGPPLRSSYQGQISFALAQNTIDVQKETRQHTLLASIALAGGAYGLLTTIYVLLFGMNKLTPWGLIHSTSAVISKVRYGKNEKEIEDVHADHQDSSKSRPISWVPTTGGVKFGAALLNLNLMRKKKSTEEQEQFFDEENPKLSEEIPRRTMDARSMLSTRTAMEQNENTLITRRSVYFPPDEDQDELDPAYLSAALRMERQKSEELESRVDELEVILSQFFIDITYLNELRSKAERKQWLQTRKDSQQ